MKGTYLVTEFRDKDTVKSLGARWDPLRKQWYVPHGMDQAGFASWLPALPASPVALTDDRTHALDVLSHESALDGVADSGEMVKLATEIGPGVRAVVSFPSDLSATGKGIPLSQLLGGISRTVASAFASGIWTTVELVTFMG